MKKTLILAAMGTMFAATTANAQSIAGANDSVEQGDLVVIDPVITSEAVYEYLTDPATVAKNYLPQGIEPVSILPGNDDDVIEFEIETDGDISEQEMADALATLQANIADYAKKFLGRPYVWGAKGPKSFDCSGFTGYVLKNFGYDIGPCSRVQATRGEKIDIKDARVGDLLFFSRPKGGKTVGHVGMVIDVDPETGALKFIHASSKKGVVIQNFPDSGHYNRRFLQARRVIDDSKLVAQAK